MTAAVNGYEAEVRYYTEGDTTHYVEYKFALCFGGETITSVYVNDVAPPVPGEKPRYEVITDGDGYEVSNIVWVDMTKESFVESTDVFEDGGVYRVYIPVAITDSAKYRFSSQINTYVNGEEATVDIIGDEYAIFWYEFPICSSSTPGDVNRDTKINLADVTGMLQYIAKWSVELDTEAADVNDDTNINLSDVTLLLKYIAKWDVELK